MVKWLPTAWPPGKRVCRPTASLLQEPNRNVETSFAELEVTERALHADAFPSGIAIVAGSANYLALLEENTLPK